VGVEKFVTEKNDWKKEGGFLTEESRQKKESREKDWRERSGSRTSTVVEEHGEEEEDGALEFGKGGDPGDRFRVHGMKGKPERGPESERGSAEGGDQDIDKRDDDGVQKGVDEVPAERVVAKGGVFRDVAEELQGAVIVAANMVVFVGLTGEVPDFSSKDSA